MHDIKFELVGRNVKFNEIVREIVTLQQLIDGNFNKSTLPTFFDTNNGNCGFITARRYTGIKDDTGVEIYEGDIVGLIHRKHGLSNSKVIIWDNENACFDWEDANDESWPDGFTGFIDEYEVIGNIWENPELLKGDS